MCVCACACVRVCVCICVYVSSSYGVGNVPIRFEVLAERLVCGVEGGASDEELSMAACVERACVGRVWGERGERRRCKVEV